MGKKISNDAKIYRDINNKLVGIVQTSLFNKGEGAASLLNTGARTSTRTANTKRRTLSKKQLAALKNGRKKLQAMRKESQT